MTYDYSTGRITRDWHLVKHDQICRLRGVPSRVGAYGCKHCPFHKGEEIAWEAREINDMFFTKCSHPQAEDSEGSYIVIHDIYEKFKWEALAAGYC